MYFPLQYSFAGGELAESLAARSELGKYGVGCRTLKNMLVHPHGAASNRPGTRLVAEAHDGTRPVRLTPFVFNVEQAYTLEFGHQYMRVLADGGLVLDASAQPVIIATPYDSEHVFDLSFTQSADVLFVFHKKYPPAKISRMSHRDWALTFMDFTAGTDAPLFAVAKLVGSGSGTTRTYRITAVNEETGEESLPGDEISLDGPADLSQSVFPRITFSSVPGTLEYNVYKYDSGRYGFIGAADGLNDEKEVEDISNANPAVVGITDHGYADGDLVFIQAVESMPGINGGPYTVAASTNDTFQLSGVDSTSFPAFRGPKGTCSRALVFEDKNIDADTGDTPPHARNPFDGEGNWPGTGCFHQQRLILGGTANRPNTIFGSRAGSFENFNTSSPLKDDDAFTFTIASRQVNDIRWLVSMDKLLVGTGDAELKMNGGETQAITPTSVQITPQSYRGSARLPALVVGNAVLYVQRQGNVVRDFVYSLEVDGYAGNNLTVLASHLLQGRRIVAWDYQQHPDTVVWAVRDDGILLGLTYMREHDLWAWHRHETQGAFESVSVVPDDQEDATYVVVRRTVKGIERRFIERMEARWRGGDVAEAFFVDCGLSYRGEPVSTILGLDHLAGMEVAILADGSVLPRDTVAADGSLRLPRPASVVHVGLPYAAELQTMNIEPAAADGSTQGRGKRLARVVLKLLESTGVQAGCSADRLDELKFREDEAYGQATRPFTGSKPLSVESGNGREVCVFVRQENPLPVTLLALIPELDIHER